MSLDRSFNLVFLINLFKAINITRIFYKSTQTYGTHINDDK